MIENNELTKLLAPILLMIIIRVILISLGLQLEALETYKGYMIDTHNPRPRISFYSTRSPLLQDKYNSNRIRYTQDLFYIYLYTFSNSYLGSSGNSIYLQW